MSSTQTSTTSSQQYYQDIHHPSYYSNSNHNTTYTSQKESEMAAGSWEMPYSIDDSDLMFDGKPLNMLYEENRMSAERREEKVSSLYYYSTMVSFLGIHTDESSKNPEEGEADNPKSEHVFYVASSVRVGNLISGTRPINVANRIQMTTPLGRATLFPKNHGNISRGV
jgi:hypothetical protein